jgi:hypothetical protein
VDEGAAFSAAAVVFFFISGVLVNCTPRPKPVAQTKDVEMTDDDVSVPSTLTIKTKKSERDTSASDDTSSHKSIV